MPQIEKITYITTIYWLFIFYFIVYLDLIVTYLYKFLTSLKFDLKRLSLIVTKTLRHNVDQHLVRQWSRPPLIINVSYLLIFIFLHLAVRMSFAGASKNKISIFPCPPKHLHIYEYLEDFPAWFWYWAGFFDESQWALSIGTLIVMYMVLNFVYNRVAMKRFSGTWITNRQRVIFILVDLLTNVILGPLCLMSPTSWLGEFTKACPVFLSPFIAFAEVVAFLAYQKFRTELLDLADKYTPEAAQTRVEKLLMKWYIGLVARWVALGYLTIPYLKEFQPYNIYLYFIIILFSLGCIFLCSVFLRLKRRIHKGTFKVYLDNERKKIDEIDNKLVEKYHIIRKSSRHREADLKRELASTMGSFEKISSSIFKFFGLKTKREKWALELSEIEKNKSLPLSEDTNVCRPKKTGFKPLDTFRESFADFYEEYDFFIGSMAKRSFPKKK